MIGKKEVEHVARLARIKITPEEEIKYADDLSAILDFVGKLNEVDTTKIEPLTGGTDFKNIMRPDAQTSLDLEHKGSDLLKQTPDSKDDWLKVRAVFD